MPTRKSIPKTKKSKKNKKAEKRGVLSYLIYSIYFVLIGLFIAYHLYYADKILSNVHVNGRDFGGLTAQESINKINSEFPKEGVVNLAIGDSYEKEVAFSEIDFRYLAIETTSEAFSIGRNKNFFGAMVDKVRTLFRPANISPSYTFDSNKLDGLITTLKKESGLQIEETHFEILEGNLSIKAGSTGKTFSEDSIRAKLLNSFINENFAPIKEDLVELIPQFTVEDLETLRPQLEEYLEVGYILKYEDRSWVITDEDLIKMFEVSRDVTQEVNLVLNDVEIAKKLSVVASELDRNPRGQVLEVENGKAVTFISSEDGWRLKIKESSDAVHAGILSKTKEVPLSVQVASAPEANNEFGINELIGIGTSRFKGSIPGRVQNIALASSRVSGTLVPPGSNFSFLEAVGEISRSTGYTSAYVISAGRTVLGDGGGVCQVSTTMFRAALNAGLPIIERNAHSYRVGYYEQDSPPGIDAAIYGPSLDLKFKNDTPNYILITTEVDQPNSHLTFKIYGTKDGREVEMTEPKILSTTPPPAPVYEEDPSLPKGQTKQVENAVWGASVVFDRIVKKEGEVIIEDTFKSNFRAWRAIYKVGTQE